MTGLPDTANLDAAVSAWVQAIAAGETRIETDRRWRAVKRAGLEMIDAGATMADVDSRVRLIVMTTAKPADRAAQL